MKYKVTLNNRVYEVEVEAGKAMLLDEYEVAAPAAPAPVVAAAPVADLLLLPPPLLLHPWLPLPVSLSPLPCPAPS